MQNLQRLVADTADRLGLHSTAPSLVLDLQAALGGLAAEVVRATEHGRRPFRPTPGWETALGEVAFGLVNLADQTGVDLEQATRLAADQLYQASTRGPSRGGPPDAWPFSG